MTVNSHFLNHNVEHLSASSINLFIADPCLFLLKVGGFKSEAGPAAWRGTAVDSIAFAAAGENAPKIELLTDSALDAFDGQVIRSGGAASVEKMTKERDDIPTYVAQARQFYQSLGETPESEQGKIEIYIGDIEVPFIGYYDLLYKNAVRDCKTVGRMVSALTAAHARQGAIYAEAMGVPAHIDYIGKRGTATFEVKNHGIYIDQVYRAAKAIEIALSRSSDIAACCEAFYPNTDHWMWDQESIHLAKDIWRMEESTIKTRKNND